MALGSGAGASSVLAASSTPTPYRRRFHSLPAKYATTPRPRTTPATRLSPAQEGPEPISENIAANNEDGGPHHGADGVEDDELTVGDAGRAGERHQEGPDTEREAPQDDGETPESPIERLRPVDALVRAERDSAIRVQHAEAGEAAEPVAHGVARHCPCRRHNESPAEAHSVTPGEGAEGHEGQLAGQRKAGIVQEDSTNITT